MAVVDLLPAPSGALVAHDFEGDTLTGAFLLGVKQRASPVGVLGGGVALSYAVAAGHMQTRARVAGPLPRRGIWVWRLLVGGALAFFVSKKITTLTKCPRSNAFIAQDRPELKVRAMFRVDPGRRVQS